jgi:hypothetical protein
MCWCTLSLTSVLDVMGGQRHAPAVLPRGMIRYTLYRRLGGTQGQTGGKSRTSPGFNHRTVQPVRSRLDDYDILTGILTHTWLKKENRKY